MRLGLVHLRDKPHQWKNPCSTITMTTIILSIRILPSVSATIKKCLEKSKVTLPPAQQQAAAVVIQHLPHPANRALCRNNTLPDLPVSQQQRQRCACHHHHHHRRLPNKIDALKRATLSSKLPWMLTLILMLLTNPNISDTLALRQGVHSRRVEQRRIGVDSYCLFSILAFQWEYR